MLDLCEAEGVDKFYLSHLVYAGRGDKHRGEDTEHARTRAAMDVLLDRAWSAIKSGHPLEIVTGNNDADGPFMLQWVMRRFPERAAHIEAKLRQWGGNASGVNVANIDNLGIVHPDTMWWHVPLGNVRQRAFGEIWNDLSNPLLAGLKQHPRKLEGRCGACKYLDICNGSSRVRAEQVTGNPWAEDPACYLDDDEIGVSAADYSAERVVTTPWTRISKVSA